MGMVAYLCRASADEVGAVRNNPDSVDDFIFDDARAGRCVDFDKAWHALHFMLTGEAGSTDHPLNLLVASDPELEGTDELGFGGYWLTEPDRVRRFSAALSEISDVDLAGRYDPAAMVAEDIYLSDVFEDEGLEALPYVLQGVAGLRRLAAEAAQGGDYIIGILR